MSIALPCVVQMYEFKCEQLEHNCSSLTAALSSPSSSSSGSFKYSELRPQVQQLATLAEVEALLGRLAGLMEAAGIDARESTGGGDRGAHGRRVLHFGHLRRLLLRAQATRSEVRAAHGVIKQLAAMMERNER